MGPKRVPQGRSYSAQKVAKSGCPYVQPLLATIYHRSFDGRTHRSPGQGLKGPKKQTFSYKNRKFSKNHNKNSNSNKLLNKNHDTIANNSNSGKNETKNDGQISQKSDQIVSQNINNNMVINKEVSSLSQDSGASK